LVVWLYEFVKKRWQFLIGICLLRCFVDDELKSYKSIRLAQLYAGAKLEKHGWL
jgi:hypothetical protein